MLSEIRLSVPSASKRTCCRIQPGKKVKESACVAAIDSDAVRALADRLRLAARPLQGCAISSSASGRRWAPAGVRVAPCALAHEERSADPLLEGADAPAEGRLRHVTGLRRAREVALVRQGQKILEPVQIHGDAARACGDPIMALANPRRPDVNGPRLALPTETPHAHHRRSRDHPADRLADPQRLYRLLQDDREPRRGGHRRGARRPARGRLRLQLERPLRPGRPHPRALPRPHPRGRSGEPARRERRQPRSAQDLGRDDDRTRSRAATASARWRSGRSTWRCGTRRPRSPASRSSASSPSATAARPTRASSSTRPAAITIPARTTRRCGPRCAATSTAATTS